MSELPAYVRLVRAPNPGPMTLEGTNTWLVGDPAAGPLVVVDPGPAVETHLRAVLAAARGAVAGIVLTHRHADHAESAAELARRAGCGVRAADPGLRVGSEGLEDGDVIRVAGVTLTAVPTPGHTSDSCTLLLRGADDMVWLLTGDTVLGRGTSLVNHPDGDLGDYLASLERLQRLVVDERVVALLPGHGPVVDQPGAWLEGYVRHRRQRLAEVRSALAAGARTPEEVVDRVYNDLDPLLKTAAALSVRAQWEFLSSLPSES